MSTAYILITGSREWDDTDTIGRALMQAWLDLGRDAVLVSGAARGADKIAEGHWQAQGLTVERFPVTPAEWKRLGRRAGPARNQRMVDFVADRRSEGSRVLCLAFIKNNSSGASGTVEMAEAADIEVRVLRDDATTREPSPLPGTMKS